MKFRAGGFESLLQIRVTDSLHYTPDPVIDTETLFGASKEDKKKSGVSNKTQQVNK